MSAPPVEARSLSSLTTLFANPPRYPRNPSHAKLEPLVLYIVRVPGSRGKEGNYGFRWTELGQDGGLTIWRVDVFLSPLKPSTKASISVEAINASLYYLHVVTPDDEIIRESLAHDRQALERAQDAPPRIPRRGLPPTPFANYPASHRPPPPPKSYPHYQPPPTGNGPDTQAARFAARGQHIRFNVSGEGGSNVIKRKPLGPRPFHSRGQSLDADIVPLRPIPMVDLQENVLPYDGDPASKDRASISLSPDPAPALSFTCQDPELGPSEYRGEQISDELVVMLIRRDPATGSQWNVGSIKRKGGPSTHSDAFSVEITTPGYQKFALQTTYPVSSNNEGIGLSAKSINKYITPDAGVVASLPSVEARPRTFAREVTPARSHSASASFSSDDADIKLGQKANALRFESLWNGTCVFTTGINGRSLKCRHTLSPALGWATDKPSSVPVAELRFNLPRSGLKGRDENGSSPASESTNGLSSKEKFRRTIHFLKEASISPLQTKSPGTDHSWSTGEEDSPDSAVPRLDLGLGREKAGGGRGGKCAKLGKLIVEDEGLKMADLVVGASMGIWWRVYAGPGR